MVESLANMEETKTGQTAENNPENIENDGPVAQKHQALAKEEGEGVELLDNKYT